MGSCSAISALALAVVVVSVAGGCSGNTSVVVPTSATAARAALLPQRTLNAAGQETVLYAFTGGSDGAGPQYGVIADSTGALLGTTAFGGGPQGFGTVFELTPNDSGYRESVLHRFSGGLDGRAPMGLASGPSGARYGFTLVGGYNDCQYGFGCGTVFELTPNGSNYKETVVYRFAGGTDPDQPLGTPVVDKSGNIYGVAAYGGASNEGVVFKLTPSGSGYSETLLYSLPGGAGGETPQAGLTVDSHGALYGTTYNGGDSACDGGCGVVFKLTPPAYTAQTVHTFKGGPDDGAFPYAALTVDDRTGAIYGTTQYGGAHNLYGVVFKLARTGSAYAESILHSFDGSSDGYNPESPVLLAADGSRYGTTTNGQDGKCACGLIFKLTPSRTGYSFSRVYGFSDPATGADPQSTTLIPGANGALYGTTKLGGLTTSPNCDFGGPDGCGVVFRLAP